MNLQPLLTPPKSAPDISICTAAHAPDEFLIYYGLALVERVNRNTDGFWIKLLAARLYNLKFKVATLTSTFGCAHTTLRRWGLALLSGDADRIHAALSGQGPALKVTPPIDRYIRRRFKELYGQCRNYSQTIRDEVLDIWQCKLSAERLRWIFKEERDRLERENGAEESVGEPDSANNFGANSCDSAENSSSISDLSPNYSLWPGVFPGSPVEPGHSIFCHHAGLVLAGRSVEAFLQEWRDSASKPLLRQFCAQLLSGAVNYEQSKLLHSRSLETMIGCVIRTVRYQRDLCDELATPANIRQLLQCNLRYMEVVAADNAFYYPMFDNACCKCLVISGPIFC